MTESAAPWYHIGQNDPYVLVPFLGYTIAVFIIAILSHRYLSKSNFETEYYVGSRSFGAWVLAFSWVATLASGGTFLGYPSLVYSYGWSVAFWVAGSMITAIVGLGMVGKRINRLARQTGALTLVDLLRDRYHSRSVGVIYAVLIVLVTSVYLIAQFVAGARILESMLETSYEMGLLIFAVSVVAYTTYGGFRAVAWTDTMQGIIMIIGIVILVPLALNRVGGLENATKHLMSRADPVAIEKGLPQTKHAYLYGPGPEKVSKKKSKTADSGNEAGEETADDSGGDRKESPTPNPWLPFGVGMSLFMLRSIGGIVMPTTVPRMLAFRDTTALKRALILLAPYFILMYGSSLITMNCAHAIGLELAPDQSDRAVPELAKIIAPPFLAGLLIAAPFAAVMSTVDSALLVISGSVVRDIVHRTFVPDLSQKAMKTLIFCTTGVAGLIVFLAALMIEPAHLQPLVIHYVGASASALFWPGMATFFWRRATGQGVTVGLAGGLLVYLLAVLFKPFNSVFPMHPFIYGFLGSLALVAIGSLATPKQPEDRLRFYFGSNH